ncbi:MAG: asparaginase [Candidatus Dormibacteraeota bacterium]|nr:asparaginase [Candidatus Dormibacteraeota bacterium]
MPEPALLATGKRGGAPELTVRGHLVVVDAEGSVLAAAGDPDSLTTLRSCVKPLQALPFVRLAMERLGAGNAELAVACASHSGEPVHVEAVRRLLALGGVAEEHLACGAHLPFDDRAARQVILEGGPRRIHNNCSGKHAAMLVTCAVMGWPLEGYRAADHPCQLAVTEAMSTAMRVDLRAQPWGVDGCGLPTYGLALREIAAGFARAQPDPSFGRCRAAMAARPDLVAGTGRFDTALLASAGGSVTAKTGGAAVWAASLPGGWGMAIKLEAGASEALPAVALGALVHLGAVAVDDQLATFVEPELHNWEGTVVGRIRAEPSALEPLEVLRASVPRSATISL